MASSADLEKQKTTLYLAYGSNLCYEVFQGRRGIRPLAQVNVVVPSVRLTFNLPGLPYIEPCFSNLGLRSPPPASGHVSSSENIPPYIQPSDYHKDRWKKGLVGVVYEVTLQDYAHIISTEGGGSEYKDVVVDCYPLTTDDTVPEHPTGQHFKAHTLFASADDNGFVKRPDPSYAQPSARYLRLITTGAKEHSLPKDYQAYLTDIRSYSITTVRQRLGRAIFNTVWIPLFVLLMILGQIFQDKHGKSPMWLISFGNALLTATWAMYDGIFRGLFGDGERTIEKADDAV